MNIALIGASGFVGTRLIDRLKDKYSIVNFDRQQSKKYPELTEIVDIRNKEALKSLLKSFDLVVLLAAEHRDDVSPTSLYYDVNVEGTRNVLNVMDANGIKNIIFTSSVAVYGLNKTNPNESHPVDPFNHYGKSKWQAEEVLREWHGEDATDKMLRILRPTVIFGERNRGNVYNLLKQISSGKFLKIGQCNNKKSMAYVGNIVAFIEYLIETAKSNYEVYNYIDKPDLSMNELIEVVGKSLDKKIPSVKIPYWLGMFGGYCFDVLAWITRKKLSISSVRVKKFCATTQFDSGKAHSTGFVPPYTLSQGIDRTIKFEFVDEKEDDIVYVSE
jgi:nucleoside-diphosphate-sugar epimerase